MKQIPQYATHCFACGTNAGNWMFGTQPYTILFNAIDAKRYQYSDITAQNVKTEFGIDKNCLVVGHVGRFDPQKNHTFLLDVFAECVKMHPNAKLLLVGDGNGKSQIQEKVNRLGLQEHVIFTGVRADVDRLMQAMDVFVFPSLYEGVPVATVEAQASGLKCIISNKIPSECIVEKDLVFVKKLTDTPEEWAKAIIQASCYTRKRTLRTIQASGYDVNSSAKSLEEFYLKQYGGQTDGVFNRFYAGV